MEAADMLECCPKSPGGLIGVVVVETTREKMVELSLMMMEVVGAKGERDRRGIGDRSSVGGGSRQPIFGADPQRGEEKSLDSRAQQTLDRMTSHTPTSLPPLLPCLVPPPSSCQSSSAPSHTLKQSPARRSEVQAT
jgi:hypothetical protein